MQAIQTRYLGPTMSRGARIKATCAAGSITISYPHELSGQEVHRKAAEALASKFKWNLPSYGGLLGGQLCTGNYVFVFDNIAAKD
jgi:hypothetical protein